MYVLEWKSVRFY